jgi:hypothetical protein
MNFGGEGGGTSSSAEQTEHAGDGSLSRQTRLRPGGTEDATAAAGRWRAAHDGSMSRLGSGSAVDVRVAGRRRWARGDVSVSGRPTGGGHQKGGGVVRGWSSVGDTEWSRLMV